MAQKKILVDGLEVRIKQFENEDYVCITDIAKYGRSESKDIIRGYIRNRTNIEFLGLWEKLHNENFKVGEFTHFKNEIGAADFYPSISQWVETTGAVGLVTKKGRFGGTYAHRDIAVQFCTWFNASFYLYFVKEFQRLKIEETATLEDKEWDLRRELSKRNYFIHTDAVRENRVPMLEWNTKREAIYFASEADLLNKAVFGKTAQEWRISNPDKKGNMRQYATTTELEVLANLESNNATLLEMGYTQNERFSILTKRAKRELDILTDLKKVKQLK